MAKHQGCWRCDGITLRCDESKCRKCLQYYCNNCMYGGFNGCFCKVCYRSVQENEAMDPHDYLALEDLVWRYGKDHVKQVLAKLIESEV